MAPHEQLADVVKRDLYCPSGYYLSGATCYSNSSWYWWGRWVFAGIVILLTIALLLILARNSRRRRRQGIQPLRGTGWMAPAPPYYPPPPQYSAQAPAYPQEPQQTGQKFNQNEGYYSGQNQEGIQLQQPQHTYQPPNNTYPTSPNTYPSPSGYPHNSDPIYAPPPGPPPTKHT